MRHRNMKLGLEQPEATGELAKVQGKRCQYQIYQLGSDLMGSSSSPSLATQLNPISEAASLAIGTGDRSSRAKGGYQFSVQSHLWPQCDHTNPLTQITTDCRPSSRATPRNRMTRRSGFPDSR